MTLTPERTEYETVHSNFQAKRAHDASHKRRKERRARRGDGGGTAALGFRRIDATLHIV